MQRIRQLDGIRGLAIILVILWHYVARQLVAPPGSGAATVVNALKLTFSGVDLFFVLSGFLIVGILLDHRGAPNFFRVFYLRRVCRIFPLYFLLVLIFVVLKAVLNDQDERWTWALTQPFPLWSYLTFTQNIFMSVYENFGGHTLAITWSLAVEEQFYLIVPLLVALLPPKKVFWVFIAGIFLAPILRWKYPGIHCWMATPWRADSLFAGACLAILVRSLKFTQIATRHKRWILAAFLVLLAGAVVITIRRSTTQGTKHLWLAGLYFFLILIAVTDDKSRIARFFRSAWLVWLGTLSYGIYMFHETISGLLHGWLRGGKPKMETWADVSVTVLALGVTFALAVLSHRFFEQPILKIGHRFRYHDPAPNLQPPSKLSLQNVQPDSPGLR
jgi:peptidoglycan/LPS O-acetylase OafA/YrhL